MSKFGIAPGSRGTRRRIATAFAAAGALLLSSGMVVLATSPAAAGAGVSAAGGSDREKVAICHRRAGDKNPYGIMFVAANSTVLEAHRDHQVDDGQRGEDKYWKSDGTWNGIPHLAGAHKPDYVFGDDGTPETLDAFITWCKTPGTVVDDDDDEVLGELGELDVTLTGACNTYGSIVPPAEPVNVTYSIEGGQWTGLAGEYDVTATLTELADDFDSVPSPWVQTTARTAEATVDVGDFTACGTADLATVTATPIDDCDVWGSVSRPADTDDVRYEISGGEWSGLEGSVTVTATLQGDATGFTSTDGWEATSSPSVVTKTFELGEFDACDDGPVPTLVSPQYPTASGATCSGDGRLVVPNQPAGVEVQRSGSAPGTVTFTYSPADGYRFPDAADREVSVLVEPRLTGGDCIKGVETLKPRPRPGTGPADRNPQVLGEQAVAVPTAVAAGVGGTTTAATTTASPQLAQALVAAGLLMLVAAGATGLGRRTRGAHES